MHLDEPAAVDGPYQTGATGIVERPLGAHNRTKPSRPSPVRRHVRAIFLASSRALAIGYELPPTVPRDVIRRTISVETGNPLDPIDWNEIATFACGS
jgi:hypothetical protein